MAKDRETDVRVQQIVFEMAMAFGSKIKPDLLSDDAVAAFRDGFSRSVRDALDNHVKWDETRPGKRNETWRVFVLRLVRKVAKKLNAGHSEKKKVSAASFKDAVIQIGKKNGCPPDGPEFVARWCSDFIKVPPARKKRKSKKAPSGRK